MRIKALDFFRGVAIILVLARHGLPDNVLQHIGWIGVDLFFVLSGFLIAGLLFKEYLSVGKVVLQRFIARRALKIIPPFYVFIIICVILKLLLKQQYYDAASLLNEIVFIQNYLSRLWLHTWSLAVEVHFYLLFTCFAWFVFKYKIVDQRQFMIAFLSLLYMTFFLVRFIDASEHRNERLYMFFQTHLRLDGLLIGVLLAYLYHFGGVAKFFRQKRLAWLGVAATMIVPVFIFEGGSFFMNTIGMSLMNAGFALLVLLGVEADFLQRPLRSRILQVIFSSISFVGVCSYSIYIWQFTGLRLAVSLQAGYALTTILYFIFAISIGIMFYFLIEKPMIRLRVRPVFG